MSTATFPSSYLQPPPEATGGVGDRPALNLQLGGINVSVGGAAGTGVYRGAGEGVSVQAEGLNNVREGVKDLWGKVRQGVEQRLQ